MTVRKGLKLRLFKKTFVLTPGQVFVYIFMTALAVITVMPLVYIAVTAFKPYDELFLFPPRFYVQNPTMDNWKNLIGAFDSSSVPFLRYVLNSLFTTAVTVVSTIIVSSLAAYGFSKKRIPFKNTLFALVIAALTFPVHVTQIPNYMVVNSLGLTNTLFALIIPKIAVAYNLFLMKQFCDPMPDALLEAARIDGAGEGLIFFKLVLPMLRPAWATLVVLSFVSNWNDYFSALVFITDDTKKTLPLILTTLSDNGSIARAGAASAGTFLMVMPTILIFALMQKRVIETMTYSGIKG